MKSWRPEGFKNPYISDERVDFAIKVMLDIKREVWELCADAMLDALRKRGVKTDITNQDLSVKVMYQIDQETINAGCNPKGTLVFIPEDSK